MVNNSKENLITKGLGVFEDSFVSPIAKKIVETKLAIKIPPNLISFIKIINIAFFPIILFLLSNIYLKVLSLLLLFFIYSLLDRLDGGFARLQNKSSKFGELIDGTTDKLFEILILISLGIYFNSFYIYLGVSLFILFISYTGERFNKIYNLQKRQESIYTYSRKRGVKNRILFLILLITRNDFRRILTSISITCKFGVYIWIYYFLIYLLYCFHIIIKCRKMGIKNA